MGMPLTEVQCWAKATIAAMLEKSLLAAIQTFPSEVSDTHQRIRQLMQRAYQSAASTNAALTELESLLKK